MARKLLPAFFTLSEFSTNRCIPQKLGKAKRPLADQEKLGLLFSTYLWRLVKTITIIMYCFVLIGWLCMPLFGCVCPYLVVYALIWLCMPLFGCVCLYFGCVCPYFCMHFAPPPIVLLHCPHLCCFCSINSVLVVVLWLPCRLLLAIIIFEFVACLICVLGPVGPPTVTYLIFWLQ